MPTKSEWFSANRSWLERKVDYRFVQNEPAPPGITVHKFIEDTGERLKEQIAYAILDDFMETFDRFPKADDTIKLRAHEPVAPRGGKINRQTGKLEGAQITLTVWWSYA